MTDPTHTPTAAPVTTPSSEPTTSGYGTGHGSEQEWGALEQVASVAMLPVTIARQLLPDNPVPVALGAGALAIAGVIEWPVAAAVGLGYLAFRRWAPRGAGHGLERTGRSGPTGV